MNEAIDMGMEDYTEEEDMDKVYGQICEEIGIDASAEHVIHILIYYFVGNCWEKTSTRRRKGRCC